MTIVKGNFGGGNGPTTLDDIDLDTQEHAITVLEQLTWSMDCYREKI